MRVRKVSHWCLLRSVAEVEGFAQAEVDMKTFKVILEEVLTGQICFETLHSNSESKICAAQEN